MDFGQLMQVMFLGSMMQNASFQPLFPMMPQQPAPTYYESATPSVRCESTVKPYKSVFDSSWEAEVLPPAHDADSEREDLELELRELELKAELLKLRLSRL